MGSLDRSLERQLCSLLVQLSDFRTTPAPPSNLFSLLPNGFLRFQRERRRVKANVSREYGEMRSELSRVKEIASCDVGGEAFSEGKLFMLAVRSEHVVLKKNAPP